MATFPSRVSIFGSVFLLATFLQGAPAWAATVTVCPSGCDQVTIQAAATAANPGDTIQVLSLSPHTEGEIFLTKNLMIDGFGAGTTIIQAGATAGAATVPVFVVTNGATITMLDLTVRYGGGSVSGSDGGGIMILDGDVTLEDVAVRDNEATGSGGGIWVAAAGSLETNRTTIEDNVAGLNGGGVAAEGPVEMTDTDVSNNSADHPSVDVFGGAIWSAGILTMRSCLLDSNNVDAPGYGRDGFGGGLSYEGPNLLIEDSVIKSNAIIADDQERGGGVYLTGTGVATLRRSTIRTNNADWGVGVYSGIETLTLEDCTISDNVAGDNGGGLYLAEPARVLYSTIAGNGAAYGGGLYSDTTGRVMIASSTFSGNTATGDGGGIYAWLTGVEIASSTVTDNTADADADGNGNGGGIYIYSGASAELRNTIVASNHDSSVFPSPQVTDCSGTVQSAGYNLIRSVGFPLAACTIVGDTTGNISGVDPLLDVLDGNGGPTETHALGPGSVAINAGNPAGCRDPDNVLLDADQRHALRLDRCDMGAFEVGAYFEPFFADGFESGSTNAWSATVP